MGYHDAQPIRSAASAAGVVDLRAAASAMMSRYLLAARAGITFGGARDTYEILGYEKSLDYKKFRARHRRDDLATRIVSAFPAATWSTPPSVVEDEDPKTETDFERAFKALASRLKLWHHFDRLDRLAQIGSYAVLLIGADGPLDKPLKRSKSIPFVMPYSEGSAIIDGFVEDVSDPRFGMPAKYRIDLLGDLKAAKSGSTREGSSLSAKPVDASRVIHFAEGLLEDNVYGTPRLEAVWNRLDDLAKVVGGGAEAFWITANRGMEFALKPGATMTDDAATALEEEAAEFHHGLRRILRTQGVDTKVLGAESADGEWLVDALFALIAGTTGIPKRILTGSEEGSLASTQDRHNWNERVAERERTVAEPMALRPFIDRMVELGALPEPKGDFDGGYRIDWPAQKATTIVEQGQVAESFARAAYSITIAENVARLGGFEPAISTAEWRDEFTPFQGQAEGERARESRPATPPAEDEPDDDATPRANAKDEAFDQVREAIGRRAKAEAWQAAIEAWALAELEQQGADLAAAFDALGMTAAAAAVRSAAPAAAMTLAEKAKIEAAIAGLRRGWEERTRAAAEPVLGGVISEAGRAAARGVTVDFDEARDAMAQFVADYSFKFARKTSETSAEIVRSVLDAAVDQGQTVAETRAALLDRFTADVTRAQLIARTETIRASNAGAAEVYRIAGVERKRWITAGDACEFCQQFEGREVGIDENFAARGTALAAGDRTMRLDYEDVATPPLHPACRCSLVPVVV